MSSSTNSIHPPLGAPPPYPVQNSPVPMQDRTINWAGREVLCRREPKLSYSYVPIINRIGKVALYALGALIAGILIKSALYAPIVATILLGIPGIPISIILFALGSHVGSQSLQKTELPEERISREKEIERALKTNPNLKWNDAKAMFRNQTTFSNEDLDYIFFEKEVSTLTSRQFSEKHGIEGIGMLTPFRKTILKNKFLNEIAIHNRGLKALTEAYNTEMNLLGVSALEIWNKIKQSELTYLFSDVILRNGDIRSYLTEQEKNAIANDSDQPWDLSDPTRPLEDFNY